MLKIVYPTCCGMDVHKSFLVACIASTNDHGVTSYKNKRKRAYEKQVQMSGFPIKKTLVDFDFTFQPSIDKRQIEELATMRFLENAENIV